MGFVRKAIAAYAVVVLVILVGWVMNIIAVVPMSFDPLTGMAVLRVLGIIVPPLGAVLGYFA